MSNLPIYEMLAQAFASEGVDAVFNLMGDGNMHWATAMSKIDGVQSFHARHEHCAVRHGAWATTAPPARPASPPSPAVPASPRSRTILSTATRARVPLVVFAGESPINAKWYNQAIDQAPLVTATGAHYVRAHSAKLMHEYVREAFYTARYERRPTVLGVPYDLQKVTWSGGPDYKPSADYIPQPGRTLPSPESVARLADKIASAKRPIIIGGRGAVASGAQAAIEELAEAAGALLATTLPGRGMFDASPYSVGVTGGFASAGARELFAEADLVIAIGASLTYYTVDGGALFPKAYVAQIDERPLGLRDGAQAGDLFLKADAKAGAEAVTPELQAARRQERRLSLGQDCGKDQEHADRSGRVPDRARHLRSARRHRRARPRDPEGLGHRLGLGSPELLPHPHARTQAGEFPRDARVRRNRQFDLDRARRRRRPRRTARSC